MKTLEEWIIEYVNESMEPMGRSPEFRRKRVREFQTQERVLWPYEFLLDAHLLEEGLKVLEIGSGCGGLAVALARRGLRVYGLEPSFAGVRASELRAERYAEEDLEVHFLQAVGEHLPYPDECFDRVLSNQVLEHVQDVGTVLAEVYRVTRPGGYSYHCVPNYGFPYEGHYRIFWPPYLPKSWGKRYARWRGLRTEFLDELNYTYRRPLIDCFRRVGFTEVRDYYALMVQHKLTDASQIISHRKRRFFQGLNRLGLGRLVFQLYAHTGLFMCLLIGGRKSEVESTGRSVASNAAHGNA